MMETYRLDYSHEALRVLDRMERTVARRIMDKLDEACRNPDHFFERLHGRMECKLRIGDYRVLGLVDHAGKRVVVLSMDHRKRVYKRP